MELEKRAIALQQFGGVTKELPDGTRIRGDIHMLMMVTFQDILQALHLFWDMNFLEQKLCHFEVYHFEHFCSL